MNIKSAGQTIEGVWADWQKWKQDGVEDTSIKPKAYEDDSTCRRLLARPENPGLENIPAPGPNAVMPGGDCKRAG